MGFIMSQIEKDQKNFFLKGIEHIFLKIKGDDEPVDIVVTQDQKLINQKRTELHLETQRREQEWLKLFQEQEEQADSLLGAKLYDLYFAMIDSGYAPTQSQKNNLDYYINDLICVTDQGDNLALINNYIKLGYKLSPNNAYELISDSNFQKKYFNQDFFNQNYNFNNVSPAHNLLISHLRSMIFSEEFTTFASERFLNSFSNNLYFGKSFYHQTSKYDINNYPFMPHSIFNVPKFIEEIPHIILPKINSQEFINFIAKMNETKRYIDEFFTNPLLKKGAPYVKNLDTFYDDTLHILNTTLREYYSQDLNKMLHQTKVVYSKHYLVEQAIKKTQLAVADYKVTALPNSTQNIINSIQAVYNSLENHRNDLNDEQIFLIDNLFEKRIPEVLQKYFSIDQEYRNTMKTSQGKNAQELMDDSLGNFKNKLSEILEAVNANKLSDLNVSQRYSSNI